MKHNGFYKESELDKLDQVEFESFKKHIEEAHDIANDNTIMRSTLMEMELAIKEASAKYTTAALEKQEAQEELSVCEEVTRTLNREKMKVE